MLPSTLTTKTFVEKVEFTPEGLGPWSHSKIKTLKNCPFQFYLRYILKVKPVEKAPISLVTEVGKAAHRILEYMIKGKSMTDAYKLTRKEFEGALTPEQWEDEVNTLEMSIGSFIGRLEEFEKSNPIKRYVQELKVAVDKNWQATGFFSEDCYFRGVIDLAIQMENGDALFIDHKTGAPAIMGVKNFKDQLNTYKVLYHHGISPIEGAQAGIHFIRDGEIKLDDYAEKSEIEKGLVRGVEFSIDCVIENVLELGFFKHKASSSCNYCDFRNECKAGELKELEKDSRKFFPIKEIK